jgi:hypothetical protein
MPERYPPEFRRKVLDLLIARTTAALRPQATASSNGMIRVMSLRFAPVSVTATTRRCRR